MPNNINAKPFAGRVYDPACGSGGMFVQSEKFAEAHGGNKTDVSIFGQESNPTTWRPAHVNLAIHGIEPNWAFSPRRTMCSRSVHFPTPSGSALMRQDIHIKSTARAGHCPRLFTSLERSP